MTNKNDDALEKLVEDMMKGTNHNPRDYCFRFIVFRYPKSAHEVFNFPGTFVKQLNTDVFTENARNLEMDSAQVVTAGGFIDRKSTINVEHQNYDLNDDKIDSIYDYKLGLIHETNLPSISVVITNIEQENTMVCYKSHSSVFNVYYIPVTEDDIRQTLNTLKTIIKSNHVLSQEEALYFTYIAIFVKKDIDKEIIEESAFLFNKAIIADDILQLDIHHVLKIMIKEIFKDNRNKIKELLTMITEPISAENYEKFSSLNDFEQILAQKDRIISRQEDCIEKRDLALSEMGNLISEKDLALSEKDNVILEQRKEIESLKEQLDSK